MNLLELYKIFDMNLNEDSSSVQQIIDSWLDKDSVKRAQAKYNEDTFEGQLEIYNAAKSGEKDACNYLYNRYLGLIFKVWKQTIMGSNPNMNSLKFLNGVASEYSERAYFMICNAHDPSPYNSFDPNVYDKNANLLNQFGYYYYRYLQNEATKINIRFSKDALNRYSTSLDGSDDAEEFGDDNIRKLGKNNLEAISSPDSTESEDINIVIDEFTQWLKDNKDPKYSQIFDLRKQGYSIADIADKIGAKGPQWVRSDFNKIKNWFGGLYPEFGIGI